MAVHQPHLLDFSNAVMAMEAPPPSLDQSLLALHVDRTDMPSGGFSVHADDTESSWPQAAVSLSLYNYNTAPPGGSSSLVGHHQQQPPLAPTPAAVAPNGQFLLPTPSSSMQQAFQLIRSSKYLGPVKELLSEFCSVEGDLLLHAMNYKQRAPKAGNWDDVEALSSSSGLWGSPSLSSMDLLELERRKARFLSMVQEVDRRYRRYREQMRAVAASFEAVAGAGAAQVYTRLALQAMSRHFRCLRDALVAQVRSLRKAMGERDGGAAPAGATKGDTPRLRALDRCLRQQRAFHQHPGAMENCPWRPQRGLPERAVAVLRAWLFEHFLHPYPNDVDKRILARQTGLSRSQVSNWFINARVRLWKPMIEEMYTEEVKQQSEANQNPSGTAVEHEKNTTASATNLGGEESYLPRAVGNPNSMISSSIVTEGDHLFHSYRNMMHGSHNAVSLTLGLQQQPFTPSMMHQGSLILEGEEEETVLPYRYRNLMGSQLLHDLAG